MKKFTVEGFIDFIRKQPADRVINQLCWSTCAVGDYCVELGAHTEVTLGDIRLVNEAVAEARKLEKVPAGEGNFAGMISYCDTYGKAQQRLDELGM